MEKGAIAVTIAIVTGMVVFLTVLTIALSDYNNAKNSREQTTIQKCIDAGNSPLECRFAVKGNVNR